MQELVEIRLPENWAREHLKAVRGVTQSRLTRKVVLPAQDPNLASIQAMIREYESAHGALGYWAAIYRLYDQVELENAEILRLIITTVFEPPGEETGTVYDYSGVCTYCGAGRIQNSALRLQVSKIPQQDFARTIAQEWVISERLRELVLKKGLTGADFAAVFPGKRAKAPTSAWYQLQIKGSAGTPVYPTRYGAGPLDEDFEGRFRCPLGHTSGLNVLSEVYLPRGDWDGTDIAVTRNHVGLRRGALVPAPLIIISRQFYRSLCEMKATGFRVERAHLV